MFIPRIEWNKITKTNKEKKIQHNKTKQEHEQTNKQTNKQKHFIQKVTDSNFICKRPPLNSWSLLFIPIFHKFCSQDNHQIIMIKQNNGLYNTRKLIIKYNLMMMRRRMSLMMTMTMTMTMTMMTITMTMTVTMTMMTMTMTIIL